MYSEFSEKIKIHIDNIKMYVDKYENKLKCVENTEINENNFAACVLENYIDINDVSIIVDDFVSYGSYKNMYIHSVLYDEYIIFLSAIMNSLYNVRINITNIFDDIVNTILLDSKFDKNKFDYGKFIIFYNFRMLFDFRKLKTNMSISYRNIIKSIKNIHIYYVEKILKINNNNISYT